MAITVFRGMGGSLQVASAFTRPSLLLDNCALQEFAEKPDLGDMLVKTLTDTDGTLCLSGLNPAEMTRAQFNQHATAIDRLLSRVFTHLFFIDHSNALLCESTHADMRPNPPADQESALEVVTRYWNGSQARAGTGEHEGLFLMLWATRERIAPTFNKMAEKIAGAFLEQREDPEYVKKARDYVAPAHTPRINSVVAELMRDLMLSPQARIPASDAVDLLHACMGLTFCDFVALDSKWVRRAKQARKRLSHVNQDLGLPFGPKESELSEMLQAMAVKTS